MNLHPLCASSQYPEPKKDQLVSIIHHILRAHRPLYLYAMESLIGSRDLYFEAPIFFSLWVHRGVPYPSLPRTARDEVMRRILRRQLAVER
ncbi:hypothetical protein Csa_013212 [Cucumis sativus]|uniref:Uncharacterized protein n=1 Tax=Cucumis sativus TaxID=3659 RepID=A0A0A0LSK7_CUCSA|nr:hypothetical protein Csa_013212 [Cucumis sativus]